MEVIFVAILSDGVYDGAMEPVLVLVAPGFEEIELVAPVDIMRRLGIPVVLAGVCGRLVEGAHGMVVQADMLMVDVDAEKFSAIVLPGGEASWLLRDTPGVLRLVSTMYAAGKVVGAICAAPIVLEAAGILGGCHITCYPASAVTSAIKSAAEIIPTLAMTDRNIVTGRGPGAAVEFAFEIVKTLGIDHDMIVSLREEMCLPR